MKIMKVTVVASMFVLAVFPLTAAPKGGGGSTSVPVISTVYDQGSGFTLHIGSDGKGPYSGSSSTASEIQISTTGSDWVMDSGWGKPRPSRSNFLDFTEEALNTAETIAPFPQRQIPVRFVLKCADRGVDLLKIAPGASADCALVIHFNYGAINYRIGINKNSQHVTEQYGEDARVTCTASGGSGCTKWQIAPAGLPTFRLDEATNTLDPNPKSIGMLFDKNGETLLGYYYFSFFIEFAR